jgi:hypothetical protein
MWQCLYPQLNKDGTTFFCGKCVGCRQRHQSGWALRVMLESTLWPSSLFVTLTYDENNLPLTADFEPTLSVRDIQLFFKRLRKTLGRTIRYFGSGEYGPTGGRPHYHLVIFNVYPEEEEIIWKAWNNGFITTSELTPQRANYAAKYTLKLRNPDEVIDTTSSESLLDGIVPERAFMSRNPGIGSIGRNMIQDWASRRTSVSSPKSSLTENGRKNLKLPTFPGYLKFGKTLYPVPRYLKSELNNTLNAWLSSQGVSPQDVKLLMSDQRLFNTDIEQATAARFSNAERARRSYRKTVTKGKTHEPPF